MKDKMQSKCTKKSYSEKVAEDRSNGTRYRLRTEFRGDCQHIFCLLKPWLLSWKESPGWGPDDSHVDGNGRIWASQNWAIDTDVEFIMAQGAPTLEEMRWLINAIPDCHVAAQTVSRLEGYTGERDYEATEELAKPPTNQIITSAIKSIREQRQGLENGLRHSKETIGRLQVQLGDDEPYKRRLSKSTARNLLEYVFESKDGIDPVKLEELVYRSIVVDRGRGTIEIRLGQ